jgi:hypothetical protein
VALLMNFENFLEKKEYFAQELARFLKKLAPFANRISISPYFSENNKDLKHVFKT